jgi:hypothetical protein
MVSCTLGVFGFAFISLIIAFFSSSWIVLSDYKDTTGRLEGFGLWTQCFRYLPANSIRDTNQSLQSVGCQLFYDPFTLGLDTYRRLPAAPCEFFQTKFENNPTPHFIFAHLINYFFSID